MAPFYFLSGELSVDGKLCMSGRFSFAIMNEQGERIMAALYTDYVKDTYDKNGRVIKLNISYLRSLILLMTL